MTNTLDSHPETLTTGQPAFLLGYHDRAFRMPFVEPYVFIGVRTNGEAKIVRWCFQKAESYLVHPKTGGDEVLRDDVLSVDASGLGTMVDWPGLVAELAARLDNIRS